MSLHRRNRFCGQRAGRAGKGIGMNTKIKVVLLAALMAAAMELPAQIVQTLCSFDGTNGGNPVAAVTQGKDGNFYGTTWGVYGGKGTVFMVTTNGTLTSLATFDGTNGANPWGVLTQTPDGDFYGTTYGGGSSNLGTIFKITTNGTLTTVVSFLGTNGAYPAAGMMLASDGNLYGTTLKGGPPNVPGLGTIFKVTTNGIFTTLYSFQKTLPRYENGAEPQSELMEGPNGDLYGTTSEGALVGVGTVFKMTKNGTLTTLAAFSGSAYGVSAYGPVLGPDGNLYGTTYYGGTSGYGSVYRFTTNNNQVTTLVSFNYTNGAYPQASLILGNDGSFYGTTIGGGAYRNGTIFQVTTNGMLTTLFSCNVNNGSWPQAALTLGNDGNLYGAAGAGGVYGRGTVFRLILSPVITAQVSGGQPIVNLSGPLGHDYGVQYATDLSNPQWTDLLTITNLSTNSFDIMDSEAAEQPGRFYRAFIK